MSVLKAKSPIAGVSLAAEPPRNEPTQSQPESQPDATIAETAYSADEAAHLSAFLAADLDPGGGQGDRVTAVGEDGTPIDDFSDDLDEPGILSKEAFFEMFSLAFGMPGMFMAHFAPLAIQPDEKPNARVASDAIHRLLEIWCPSVLKPGGETVTLLIASVPFILGKAYIVREIMVGMRRQAVEDQKRASQGQEPPQAAGVAGEGDKPNYAPPRGASPLDWMEQEARAA